MKKPEFDLIAGHKYFAANCFNATWDLLDKSDRTPEEDEQMIRLSMTSLWHWTQREDFTKKNESIGYWQISRVYAVLGQAEDARKYGHFCLAASQDVSVEPFYLGYAYEALARAESVAGNQAAMREYLEKARQAAALVQEAESRQMLESDLDTIQ
jgi:hypothetical protein